MIHYLLDTAGGTYITFILLAIFWGAFSELRKKQYGWFSIRLIVMVACAAISNLIQYHHI